MDFNAKSSLIDVINEEMCLYEVIPNGMTSETLCDFTPEQVFLLFQEISNLHNRAQCVLKEMYPHISFSLRK